MPILIDKNAYLCKAYPLFTPKSEEDAAFVGNASVAHQQQSTDYTSSVSIDPQQIFPPQIKEEFR